MSRLIQISNTVALIALMALTTGCEKVTKPASDNTPPTLKWHVENQSSNTSESIIGNGAVTAKEGETVRVTLTSEDPEGVSYIELGGGYVKNCVASGVASNSLGSFGTDQQTLAPDADNKVLTKIFLIKTTTPDTNCPGGTNFAKTTVTFNGVGRNYFSGQTTAALAVNVVP